MILEKHELEVSLTSDEIKAFNEYCLGLGVDPARKIGELIHGFVLSKGVKHRRFSALGVKHRNAEGGKQWKR